MQNIIVVLIVIIAAVYLVRRFYRGVKRPGKDTCGCGCSGCSQTTTCGQVPASSTGEQKEETDTC
ncbi:MAG: FeoB-associated Cys-rich membrane protein [Deltaproteobacteria bacterium]|nr:FeoB-associated Cys-rich membrane protein [Deltaproteobacteria bacterium]